MAATRTFVARTNSGADASYNFTSQDFGSEDAGRYIVVCVAGKSSSTDTARTLDSVTVGGVSATIVLQQGHQAPGQDRPVMVAIAIAAVPTGTSGTISVVWSGFCLACSIMTYRLVGLGSPTASDTSASTLIDPAASGFDVPAGGLAIACSMTAQQDGSCAWSGLTEDNDGNMGSSGTASSASAEFASAQTGLTSVCDWTTFSSPHSAGVWAAWAGAGGGAGASGAARHHYQQQGWM